MADKILSAIARGTTRTAKQGVKNVGRRAMSGLKMPSVYKLGLGIGPTLSNIKQSYASQSSPTRQSESSSDAKNYTFKDNVVQGANRSASLSSIASILSDIRRIGYAQLQISRSQLRVNDGGRAKFMRAEGELESRAKLSGLSDNNSPDQGRGNANPLFSFIKDNPLTSAILAGLAINLAPQLKDAILTPENKKKISKLAQGIVGTIGSSISSLFGISASSDSGASTTLGGVAMGGVASRMLLGRFGPGAAVGAYLANSDDPSMYGAAGAAVAGAAAPWAIGKAGKYAWNKAFGSAPSAQPVATPSATATPGPAGANPKWSRAKAASAARAAASASAAEAAATNKGTLKGAIQVIKKCLTKMTMRQLVTIVGSRVGLAVSGFAAGPVGIITTLLSIGLTLWTIYELFEDVDLAVVGEANASVMGGEGVLPASSVMASYNPAAPSYMQPQQVQPTQAPSGSTPPAPAGNQSSGQSDGGSSSDTGRAIKRVVSASAGKTTVEYEDGSVETRIGTRNVRNNNPGNLEASKYVQQYPGYVGTDGRFAVFRTYQDGVKAMTKLLNANTYKNLTVAQAMHRWGPPSENDTKAYIASIAKAGVDVNKRISDLSPEERQRLESTIERNEGGGPRSRGNLKSIAVNGTTAPASAPPGPVVGIDADRLGTTTDKLQVLQQAFETVINSKEMKDMQAAIATAHATGIAAGNASAKSNNNQNGGAPAVPAKTQTNILGRTSSEKDRLNALAQWGYSAWNPH